MDADPTIPHGTPPQLPTPLRLTLAIYQLIAAGWMLFHQADWIFAWRTDQLADRLLALALLTVATLAGIFLLRAPALGSTFTILNHLAQLLAIASPGLTYVARLGFAATLQIYGLPPTGGPGTGYFGVEAGWHWGNTSHFALGHPHPDHSGYLLSLNTLAVIVLAATLFYRRKTTQTPP